MLIILLLYSWFSFHIVYFVCPAPCYFSQVLSYFFYWENEWDSLTSFNFASRSSFITDRCNLDIWFQEQKFLIGLILMVPVYALESVLKNETASPHIDYVLLFLNISGPIVNYDLFSGQFLSLLNSDAAFNCEVIRDCYEAFALYCFERYLIACLGMTGRLQSCLLSLMFSWEKNVYHVCYHYHCY